MDADRRVSSVLPTAATALAGTLLCVEIGYGVSAGHDYATYWPLSGFLLALLLLAPRRDWPLALTVSLLANAGAHLLHGQSLLISAPAELLGVIEATVGALAIGRVLGGKPSFERLHDAVVVMAIGALAAPVVSATLAVWVFHVATRGVGPLGAWSTWLVADSLGVVVVAPLVVIGRDWVHELRAMSAKQRWRELIRALGGALIATSFGLVAWAIFTSQGGWSGYKFLLTTGILAAGALGGPIADSIAVGITATAAMAAISSVSPAGSSVPADRIYLILQAQGFFIVTGLTCLLLCVALYENRALAQAAGRDAKRLRENRDSLEQLLQELVGVMGKIVETRDPYTQGHEQGVAHISRLIATEMGLPAEQVDGIEVAALVHDIGKMGVPAEILTKPGALNAAEFALVREHSRIGYDILKDIDFPWPVAEAVLQHHERMDGSGYPRGLSSEQILVEARVLAVADVIDAMAAHRPYRAALGVDAAVGELTACSASYDAEVVAACVRLHGAGELAVR